MSDVILPSQRPVDDRHEQLLSLLVNERRRYRRAFFAYSGPGPWECVECGDPVGLELHVHHANHDHADESRENLKAIHPACHARLHARLQIRPVPSCVDCGQDAAPSRRGRCRSCYDRMRRPALIGQGVGGGTRGEAHGNARITAAIALEIRDFEGSNPNAIARRFGISRTQVVRIRRGESWAKAIAEYESAGARQG